MNHKARVCHLCSAHGVDDDRVYARECVSLAEAGYEVHLIAVGNAPAPYVSKGVNIHPLPAASSRRRRFARRRQIARMAAALSPELFHVHEPELLGSTLAVSGSRPVIWDVHESYVDVIMDRQWIPKWLRRGIRLMWDLRERELVRRCAAVVPVTVGVADRYNSMHPRVVIVANFPDLSAWREMPPLPRDGSKCVYTGAILHSRGMIEAVRAIAALNSRGIQASLDLAGPDQEHLAEKLIAESHRLGVGDLVRYHGELNWEEAKNLVQSAGIALVTYLPLPNNMLGWPTKMFQCMAHGLPLVYSNFASYREVAETSGAGIAVDPTDPNAIADAIERLICNPELAKRMGESGRRAVFDKFNWNSEKVKLLKLYEELLNSPRP
jgi:glycosyltransferase involved in cell wall biosynthesis